jgi:pimeloyl-ACP methyl ester carboxylesterase
LGKGSAADSAGNGLCNVTRYRSGSWGNQAELNDLVQQSFLCNDPWIGQVYAEAAMGSSKPNGSGTSGECNPVNYGGGSWSNFADLRVKAKAFKFPVVAAAPVDPCIANTSALYAFDGTQTNETHKSTIWQVFKRFQGHGNCGPAGGEYIRGPNMQGSDSWDIYQKLYADACNEAKARKIHKVYVIGFSRGAINAIRFANEFPTCANGATVAFIGASDPVDALMIGYDAGKTLAAGRAPSSFKVTKSRNDMSVNPLELVNNNFYTAATPGFAKVEQVVNNEQRSTMGNADRHWMMNASGCASGRDVEERYVREMSALGIRFSAPLAAGPEPCKMLETPTLAKTAKNGWNEKGGQWERCFGAVGPGCEGAPNAGVVQHPDGSITASVAVGSILHDNCCLRNGPDGVWCGGIGKAIAYDELSIQQHVFGHCSQEWSKAVYNVRDNRMWRVTFSPYNKPLEGGDDLSQTANRHAKMSVANSPLFVDYTGGETLATRALLAPPGTVLDIDDVAFCRSGEFSERHDIVIGIGRWGKCK